MTMRFASFTLVALGMLGCGGSDDAAVVLYKPAGSLQCGPTQTTQARLAAEVRALRQAGAVVLASRCANDGLLRVALCGVSNGDRFSVTVTTASRLPALGFQNARQRKGGDGAGLHRHGGMAPDHRIGKAAHGRTPASRRTGAATTGRQRLG